LRIRPAGIASGALSPGFLKEGETIGWVSEAPSPLRLSDPWNPDSQTRCGIRIDFKQSIREADGQRVRRFCLLCGLNHRQGRSPTRSSSYPYESARDRAWTFATAKQRRRKLQLRLAQLRFLFSFCWFNTAVEPWLFFRAPLSSALSWQAAG
jgi:hypothetical protein